MGLAVMGSEGSEWGPGPTLLCARTLYSYCRGSIQRNIKSLFNKGSMHTRSILYVGHHQIFFIVPPLHTDIHTQDMLNIQEF